MKNHTVISGISVAQFGTETSPEVRQIMVMLTGAGVSVIIIVMAIYMIRKANSEIEEIKGRDGSYEKDD